MSKIIIATALILLGIASLAAPSCMPATQLPSTATPSPPFNPVPGATPMVTPAVTPAFTATLVSKPVEAMSVKELRQKLESGYSPVILDVRPKTDFDVSHIGRALSMPLQEIPNLYHELPQGTEVIVYAQCS